MKSIFVLSIILFSMKSFANHACSQQVLTLVPAVRTAAQNSYTADLNRETYNKCIAFLETGQNRKACKGTPEWNKIRSVLQSQFTSRIRSMCVSNRTHCYDGCNSIGLNLPRGGMPYAISRINSHYQAIEAQSGGQQDSNP